VAGAGVGANGGGGMVVVVIKVSMVVVMELRWCWYHWGRATNQESSPEIAMVVVQEVVLIWFLMVLISTQFQH